MNSRRAPAQQALALQVPSFSVSKPLPTVGTYSTVPQFLEIG